MSDLVAGPRPTLAPASPRADRQTTSPSRTRRGGASGLVASLFGCFFGLISVFILSIFFVPLGILCSLIGLLGASRIWIAGVALIGVVLAAVGFVTSPTLLLLTGLMMLSQSNPPSAARPAAVPQPQLQAAANAGTTAPALTSQTKVTTPSQPLSEVLKLGSDRFVKQAPGPGLHWSQAGATADWFEVSEPMVGCSQTQDSPQLQQLALRAVIAWQRGSALPADCSVFGPGTRLLLDAGQTEAERQQVIKLWAMNCRTGCLPMASPVYMPPRRIVGSYLRPSSSPDGWP